jgi:hypothetical protein
MILCLLFEKKYPLQGAYTCLQTLKSAKISQNLQIAQIIMKA